MSLKRKEALLRQKALFEGKLEDRLALITEKGIGADKAGKDPIVRNFQAEVRAIGRRLRTIAAGEKLTQDLAKMKADKAAAALKAKEGGEAEKPGKSAKAEKPKKGAEAGAAKKPKPEKKPAPKAPEGE
jgi:hypothetical protein